ncbi:MULTISPECIES: diadenylate cyclase CdaA [Maribacter]|uniref:Diadenylate cyclase n=2 Tax=Maribacter TaxID=252356 RepID=A0A5B2TVM4_9FLAO|nr:MULTISPECIES: diadenylate cyclase CdaA [Maribacter]KAA2218309.1 TIGR00159 family protein [Maribacter flavus]MDC6405001.1 diadenylate cyclase CdaA [Maribacter sp. PR66]MEE1972415.1 diadenylate cyclase CdaA [Maribacter flavus]TLF45624.1 TIGR00159 family protein [Maribacter aurantiacus]
MDFLNFIDFKITDILDIVLVAVLLYYVYKLVRGSAAINIFIGIVIVWAFWKLTELLGMEMISSIVGAFMQVGLIALIIVFQQEIRKFLLMIGSTNFANKRNFVKHFKFLKQEGDTTSIDVEAIVKACEKMSASKTGAILVIERGNSLDFIKSTGDRMNIEVTQPIIESIFYKNSPLHDGAAVIVDNYIVATRVILPVTNERSIPLRYGLRHRAAIGITEKTDALCLVVSEETGQISYIKNGEFILFESGAQLITLLKKDLV